MSAEKTHYKKLRNPDYIGAYELMQGDKTIELIVTIERAVKEIIKNGENKEGMVLYLKGQKPMIVNSVNAKNITKALGSPYVEDWTGKSITLYVAKIRAFGETVDAIRVHPTPPALSTPKKQELPELTPEHEKWAGAREAIKANTTTIDAVKKAYKISSENEKLLTDGAK